MAAARRRPDVSTPRPGSPAVGSSRPVKPQLNMEEWESKAPLSELASQSFSSLKRACEQRPLPLKFAEDGDASSSRPSTPRGLLSSRPGTPNFQNQPLPNPLHPLHPIQPISTPQQFYDWFAIVERTISHSQESHFRNHLAAVEEHLARCDIMRARVTEAEDDVRGMLKEWQSVEDGADSLQAACERLLEERDRLNHVTDELAMRMEYYTELDQATRMLNHPGDALVLQTEFLLMVERVDVCIEYFHDHRHFSEADVYLLRFQQCMTRAMTLIKMYFIGTLKALVADVHRRLAEMDMSDTAESHLLYAKFHSIAAQSAPLLAELERRAMAHPDELASLLAECHAAYFSSRKSIVATRLAREVRMLDPAKSDLVELTRSGCGYLKQLCADEFELYRRFFNSGEDKLYRYLEGLCDYLYDDLRPRILHEPQLTVLCQVCTVLQALMVIDVVPAGTSLDSDEDEDDHAHTIDEQSILKPPEGITSRIISLVADQTETPRPLRRLHTAQLLQMILQDAQTRLFFKAQAIVQADIRYYVPTPADLAYPAKLVALREKQTSASGATLNGTGEHDDDPLKALGARRLKETWYPTLQKLHWILSLLRDFVKPAIFDDMAQEAISTCRQSLLSAYDLVRVAPSSSEDDGRLFLVQNLLVLKELIFAIGSEEVRAMDVRTDALGPLLRGTSSIFGAANLLLGGSTREAGTMSDTRAATDQDLKRVCEELIASGISSATSVLTSSTQNPESTPTQFLQKCEEGVRNWVRKLRLYLNDAKTVSILVGPMNAGIVRTFESWQAQSNGAHATSKLLTQTELETLLAKWSLE